MTFSRRDFLQSSANAMAAAALPRFLVSPAFGGTTSGIVAGAIRWDAWYQRSDASVFAQNSLAPEKYHYRAPLHCTLAKDETVSCVGTQSVIDAEIKAAKDGGLKYWAFCWYGPDSSLRAAWNLYQSSSHRRLMNWCGIINPSFLGSLPFSNGKWKANVEEWFGYLQQPHYQKVMVGSIKDRPLLYILWQKSDIDKYFDDDISNLKSALDYLRKLSEDAGVASPYIVMMDSTEGAQLIGQIGADAISNYISGFNKKPHGTFLDLAQQSRLFWDKMKNTGAGIVPISMVGWDTRARQEHPVPWEHGVVANPDPTDYFSLATPQELAIYMKQAVDYINNNPVACPARLLLIYSWDECDEGGALTPTLGDPSGLYLKAIAPIIS